MLRTAVFAAVVSSCAAHAAFGQPAAPARRPVEIEVEYAWSELPRRVALYKSLGGAANRGADVGLDKIFGNETRGRSRVALRIARLWLVNLPIAALATASSDDAGEPFETAFRVGYKTEGYLTEAPYRATLLASISTAIRF